MSLATVLSPIIRSVFSRWTALQLAVSHSMGGPETEAKYEAFIEAFSQHLVRNLQPSVSASSIEQDIQDYLDEILDEEFNTVLDDGSSLELAQLFTRYIQMIQQGKLAEVQHEIQMQQAAARPVEMSIRNREGDEASSSTDSESDDGDQEEMREEPATNSSDTKPQSMDVDEDGWTTVHRRTGGKK